MRLFQIEGRVYRMGLGSLIFNAVVFALAVQGVERFFIVRYVKEDSLLWRYFGILGIAIVLPVAIYGVVTTVIGKEATLFGCPQWLIGQIFGTAIGEGIAFTTTYANHCGRVWRGVGFSLLILIVAVISLGLI